MINLISKKDSVHIAQRQGPLGPHFCTLNGPNALQDNQVGSIGENQAQTDTSPRQGDLSDLPLDNLEMRDSNSKCQEFSSSLALAEQRVFFKNSLLSSHKKNTKWPEEQLAQIQKSQGFEKQAQNSAISEVPISGKMSALLGRSFQTQNSSLSDQNEFWNQSNPLEARTESEDYKSTPFKIQISQEPSSLRSPVDDQDDESSLYNLNIRRHASFGLNSSSEEKKDTPKFNTLRSTVTNDPITSSQDTGFKRPSCETLQIETPQPQHGCLMRSPQTEKEVTKVSEFLLSPQSLNKKRYTLLLGQEVSAMKSYASEETDNYTLPRKRKNSLLKRWREGDKQLKGLYKSGLTPDRTCSRHYRQKKKSYFGRKKESRMSTVRTGLISQLFPQDSNTAFIIPQSNQTRSKLEEELYMTGVLQEQHKGSLGLTPKPLADSSLCSTAVGANGSWMPQNSSWNCQNTLKLLTPNASLLRQNKESDNDLRKSVDATKRQNPFLSATPYRNRRSREAEFFLSPSSDEHEMKSSSAFDSPPPKPIQRSPQTPRVEKTHSFYPEIRESRAQASNREFYFRADSDLQLSPRICEPKAKRHSEPIIHSPCQGMLTNSRFANDFQILQVLGKGSHGTVYHCRNRIDRMEYAVKKRCQKIRSSGHLKQALSEIYALAAISISEDNPYIVKYFSGWAEENDLYIVMELCRASLHERALRKRKKNQIVQESEMKRIMRDVTLGLAGLHSCQIVHLDIKPENVLLSYSGKYKLGDMGLARVIKQDTDIQEGDSRYLAKELLKEYSSVEAIPDLRKADIFSLGAMMYELMSGKDLATNGEAWHLLRSGKPDMRAIRERGYSAETCNWLLRMLSPELEVRPTCEELLSQFLQSPLEKKLQEEKTRRAELEARLREVKLKLRKYEPSSSQF